MATITRRDGTIEDAGESLSEFKARQQAKRIKERGLSSSEKSSGYSQQEFIDYYESKTAEASRQRAELKQQLAEQSKINPLEQSQPKGSYKVTRSDGTVVYRTSGKNAQGTYINDVYKELQKQQIINKQQETFKYVPKGAQKVTTASGDVIYRRQKKVNGKLVIEDYKPDYTKETKTIQTQFSGGSKTFIPKPSKPVSFLPPTPALDIAQNIRGTPDEVYKNTASTGLQQYAETLIKREQRLSDTKNSVYEFLHIKGKDNARWYNVFEIGKAVVRVPFEVASLPAFLYGRVNLVGRSIFDKAGRKVLKQGFKDTPRAVLSAYISKDTNTGKTYLSAQNVVNVGLTAYSVRAVAKSPVGTKYNPFYRAWEKRQVTNIKGTIEGYQGYGAKGPKYFKETVFKSSGKYKGFNYKETTILKGKSSQTIINYRGKIYNIKRTGTGGGTYKIIQPKTKLVLSPKKLPFLRKNLKVIKQGKFTDNTAPIKFKPGKAVTSQDINLLYDRGISTQYISYLEKLRTQAVAKANIKDSGQNLQFNAKTSIKVDNRVSGVITKQRTNINRVDFVNNKFTIVDKYKTPRIEFVNKPVQQPDVIINRYIKTGKAITGKEQGVIIAPRSLGIGKQQTVIQGTFTIKSPPVKPIFKNPAILKPWKSLIKNAKGTKPTPQTTPKPVKITQTGKVTKPLIDSSKIQKSPYVSKPASFGDQIALTESVLSEQQAPGVYIATKSTIPTTQYQAVNFNLLSKSTSNIKPVPLTPTIKPRVNNQAELVPTFKPIYKVEPVNIAKSTQYVKPVNIQNQNNIINQIQNQRPKTEINTAQSSRVNFAQQPTTAFNQVQNQAQIQAQIQNQAQITTQKQVFNNVIPKLKAPIFNPPRITPNIIIPPPIKLGGLKAVTTGPAGFNVFTRIKGKFTRANIKPLSETEAINYGAFRVGTTSQATFKIAPAGTTATGIFKGQGNLSDFYKKGNLYIEKKERRIKSPGELREITFKGIASKRSKNIFTRLRK